MHMFLEKFLDPFSEPELPTNANTSILSYNFDKARIFFGVTH